MYNATCDFIGLFAVQREEEGEEDEEAVDDGEIVINVCYQYINFTAQTQTSSMD